MDYRKYPLANDYNDDPIPEMVFPEEQFKEPDHRRYDSSSQKQTLKSYMKTRVALSKSHALVVHVNLPYPFSFSNASFTSHISIDFKAIPWLILCITHCVALSIEHLWLTTYTVLSKTFILVLRQGEGLQERRNIFNCSWQLVHLSCCHCLLCPLYKAKNWKVSHLSYHRSIP